MKLPGTEIIVEKADIAEFEKCLDTLFMAGGLVLSQITQLGGLESHDVQNWIKRGFCKGPLNKKYSKKQFCRLVTINILKDSMAISDIISLISYVNGVLDDESDDIISDDLLYCIFAYSIITDKQELPEKSIPSVLKEDEKQKVLTALEIMKFAYLSSQYKNKTALLLKKAGIK